MIENKIKEMVFELCESENVELNSTQNQIINEIVKMPDIQNRNFNNIRFSCDSEVLEFIVEYDNHTKLIFIIKDETGYSISVTKYDKKKIYLYKIIPYVSPFIFPEYEF